MLLPHRGSRAIGATAFAVVTTLAWCVPSGAYAQEAASPPDGPMKQDLEVSIGLGVMRQPRYMGAEEYRVRALPIVLARWRNGWFAGSGGVGYRFPTDSDFSWGVQLGYQPGRDENDAVALQGMGDIKARPEFGTFFSYRFAPGLSLNGNARYGSGNDRDGLLVDLGLRMMVPFDGGHRIVGGVSTTYANQAYTQSFFGVTSTQAITSGYGEYLPGGGIRDVTANLGYGYAFSPNVTMMTGVSYRALQGDAKDSPLTKSRNSTSANIMLTYRF